ncbi:uncharacterized protein [Atheta coriaria]|uniref:uncharacterized protein n=1 Tax=Dalotia coriaria TaxID=877792 RepID=UPI0031F3AD39
MIVPNMLLYLNILMELIIEKYFNNSLCLLHYHENTDNLVQLRNIPIYSINGEQNLILDTEQISYNSRLSSIMVAPIYENDIKTLEELAASDLKLLFFDYYYQPLTRDTRPVYATLSEKIVLIENNDDYELSEQMLSSKKFAVARFRRSNGAYYEQYQHLLQMYKRYKPIKPELFTDYLYISLRKHSMHTPEMLKLKNTAEETGLMKVWEEQVLAVYNNITFTEQMQDYSTKIENVALNMKHLKGIFTFLGGGLLVSLVVFLYELVSCRKITYGGKQ